eukprot:m.59462 g.59462  ORF g.59462 m.59462 type:complete len:300 (-) comp22708_c0_seq1:505-1404(-)
MTMTMQKYVCALGLMALPSLAKVVPDNLAAGGCDSTDKSFDYELIVMQWPGAFKQNNTAFFTNHGLWPSRDGASTASTYPCTCTTEVFDESQISSIESKMNMYWPSYEGANTDFWSHEWGKHGTCTGLTQLAFFTAALAAREAYDPIQAFQTAGVRPGQTYSNAFLTAAFQKTFTHQPLLGCLSPQNALKEVAFCLDKTTLKIKDCAATVRNEGGEFTCDTATDILIPLSTGPNPTPTPPSPPGPPGNTCVPDKHGPACTTDADCLHISGCVRCAHSGFCTTDPADPEENFLAPLTVVA